MYHFKDAYIVKVSGRDAKRYLQARLTNDIASLEVGKSCLAAALTPQGKTEGVFFVERVEEESFLLACDGGTHEQLQSALTRYIVADQVTVSSEPRVLLHTTSEVPKALTPFATKRTRLQESGWDILLPDEEKGALSLTVVDEAFHVERIKASTPSFPEELNDNTLLSETDITPYVSQTKGCYVGQEVIEKIASHGESPKVLVSLSLPGPKQELFAHTVTSAEGAPLGKIVSEAYSPNEEVTYCFASLRRSSKPECGETVLINGTVATLRS